ncbi:hypothetical protein [Halomicrobium salinisoli]|nr:hypothetical protein [Halomicrobium salinisoli]
MARSERSHLDEWAALLGDDLADDLVSDVVDEEAVDWRITEDEAN